MAASIGFVSPLPRILTSVKKGKIEYAVFKGQQSLRPRLIAALRSRVDLDGSLNWVREPPAQKLDISEKGQDRVRRFQRSTKPASAPDCGLDFGSRSRWQPQLGS